ncbi:MAG: hypothetical protein IKO44_00150 [Ruminococcus sp.]|nr:hypothetical protein [Ruminococcus sp.]
MKIEEAFERFIGKDVLLYTVSTGISTGSVIECIVEEIGDGWIRICQDDNESVVNIDHIIRIRDFPRNKNGKKKIIFD